MSAGRKGSYVFTRNKDDFILAYVTWLFVFILLKNDKRKLKNKASV